MSDDTIANVDISTDGGASSPQQTQTIGVTNDSNINGEERDGAIAPEVHPKGPPTTSKFGLSHVTIEKEESSWEIDPELVGWLFRQVR